MKRRIACVVGGMAACLGGCRGSGPERRTVEAVIGGERYALEVVEEGPDMDAGLGGRTVGPGEGMLFVFAAPAEQVFVMRDCAAPLDVAFLDEECRVIAVHAMTPEPPRTPAEMGAEGEAVYVARLRGYVSGGPAAYAVEVQGGTFATSLKPGDVVRLERRP